MTRSGIVCCVLAVGLAGCGPSDAELRALAAHGAIENDAPVKATAQIVITASAERVWSILADIPDWPKWQPDVATASMRHEPAAGAAFDWSTDAGAIHSRLVLFEPMRRIAWTGRMFSIRAVHVWTLSAHPEGRILVRTSESMNGWPLALFYSSAQLLESDQRWLGYLKAKAES